ncbi:hypothetical protein ES702_06324 [subsurface metagenome]
MLPKAKYVLARRDLERQNIQLHKPKRTRDLERIAVSRLYSLDLRNGEEDTGVLSHTLTFRPKHAGSYRLPSTEESDDQKHEVVVDQTGFSSDSVRKQTRNIRSTETDPTQHDTITDDDGEVSFNGKVLPFWREAEANKLTVMCAPSPGSPLSYVRPIVKHHQTLNNYPTSFPTSDLRHNRYAHEIDSIEGQTTTKTAIRSSKPVRRDLRTIPTATTKHTTRLGLRSARSPGYVVVAGYVTSFNSLVKDLVKKYTRGRLAEDETQNDQGSLAHQAMTYLILSNLGVSGISENETLIHLSNGIYTSRLHEYLMPLLDATASREPFDSWIGGLSNA